MEEDRVKELQSQLQEFYNNPVLHQLDFPTSLSARDRFLVHEVNIHEIMSSNPWF